MRKLIILSCPSLLILFIGGYQVWAFINSPPQGRIQTAEPVSSTSETSPAAYQLFKGQTIQFKLPSDYLSVPTKELPPKILEQYIFNKSGETVSSRLVISVQAERSYKDLSAFQLRKQSPEAYEVRSFERTDIVGFSKMDSTEIIAFVPTRPSQITTLTITSNGQADSAKELTRLIDDLTPR